MSKQVDHDKPYSDEDIEYLLSRPGGDYLVEVNRARFGELDEAEREEVAKEIDDDEAADAAEWDDDEVDDGPEFDQDVIEKVAPLSLKDLRQACRKFELGGDGTKAELQDKLLNYYQDQNDSEAGQAKVETVVE